MTLLQCHATEAKLVLSQSAGLVTEDVVDLGELLWQIHRVSFETDLTLKIFVNNNHLCIILHDWREDDFRDFEHGKKIKRYERVDDQVDAEEVDQVFNIRIILVVDPELRILIVLAELDCDASRDDRNYDGQTKVHDVDPVEDLFERAHLEHILTQVLNQFSIWACVHNHGDHVSRVLNEGATVKELIQIEVHLELGLVRKASLQTTLEVVELLLWNDAVD